jgi:hypothetical protein
MRQQTSGGRCGLWVARAGQRSTGTANLFWSTLIRRQQSAVRLATPLSSWHFYWVLPAHLVSPNRNANRGRAVARPRTTNPTKTAANKFQHTPRQGKSGSMPNNRDSNWLSRRRSPLRQACAARPLRHCWPRCTRGSAPANAGCRPHEGSWAACADCQPVDQALPIQLTSSGGQLDHRRRPVDHPAS